MPNRSPWLGTGFLGDVAKKQPEAGFVFSESWGKGVNAAEAAVAVLEYLSGRQVEVNTFHYNSVISACSGDWELAVQLLEQMKHGTVSPSEVSYGAAIKACSKGRQWQHALGLLFAMGLEPNVVVYTAAISSLESRAQWEIAIALLGLMSMQSLRADVTCLSAAMRTAKKKWEISLQLFDSIIHKELVPDLISFNTLISSCEEQGLWMESLKILNSASRFTLHPNAVSYNAAVAVQRSVAASESEERRRSMTVNSATASFKLLLCKPHRSSATA